MRNWIEGIKKHVKSSCSQLNTHILQVHSSDQAVRGLQKWFPPVREGSQFSISQRNDTRDDSALYILYQRGRGLRETNSRQWLTYECPILWSKYWLSGFRWMKTAEESSTADCPTGLCRHESQRWRKARFSWSQCEKWVETEASSVAKLMIPVSWMQSKRRIGSTILAPGRTVTAMLIIACALQDSCGVTHMAVHGGTRTIDYMLYTCWWIKLQNAGWRHGCSHCDGCLETSCSSYVKELYWQI